MDPIHTNSRRWLWLILSLLSAFSMGYYVTYILESDPAARSPISMRNGGQPTNCSCMADQPYTACDS